MKTAEEFNRLTEKEKAEITHHATFLSDRKKDELVVQLFSHPSFYIERFYDPKDNAITRHEAFSEKQRLVPYLADIKFSMI